MNKTLDSIILRYTGFGLLFLGVLICLYLVRGALPVFITGGIIAFAIEPVLQKLEKRGSTRNGAVAFVFGIYVLLVLVLLSLLAAAFQQSQTLITNASSNIKKFQTLVQVNQAKLEKSKLPPAVKASIEESVKNSSQRLQSQVPALATEMGTRAVAGIGTFFVSLFLITIISFGLMLEAQHIKMRLLMLVPPPFRRDVTELSHSINEILGRYVRGQLIVCATFGALCTVAFEVLSRIYGMQYPLVLGAAAAVIYILPYFGMAAVTISAGLTAYLTSDHPVPCAVAAVSCCIVFNLFIDYGVAPRVLGRGVGLHPLMVIFALLCGLELAGPMGTLIAVPVFAALRVIAIYLFPQLAIPLPDESPVAAAQTEPHNFVSESGKQLAEAEGKV